VETCERRLKIDTISSLARMDSGKSREITRPDRESNRAPPKYNSEALPVKPTLTGRILRAAVLQPPSQTS
jgi:hypothetical protein